MSTTEPVSASCQADVGLVMAGGGARGAYEVGVLATLLPFLEKRGQRPGVVLGTSIGALNAAHLASTAHMPAADATKALMDVWGKVKFSDLVGPLVSIRQLFSVLMYAGGLVGIPQARMSSLLDTHPLPNALTKKIIDFDQMRRNIDRELFPTLAVVATRYSGGESVVFYDRSKPDASPPIFDARRSIRYAQTPIGWRHVQSSASIPMAFPATLVTQPDELTGWYGDGGTRLNTPIKPCLKLGAKRVVVIGLNSTVSSQPEIHKPDVFDGAAQYLQALMADQVTQDVMTLAGSNADVMANIEDDSPNADDNEVVPYIFIAPLDKLTVGRLAAEVFHENLSGIRALLRAPDLAMIGHFLGAGRNAVRGELFSFLFFATEFHKALIQLGRQDAQRWLDTTTSRPSGSPWLRDSTPLMVWADG
jgi:NTE family protein